MTEAKNKNVKIGNVFQILTSQGVCYGLVTHKHPKYQYVISLSGKFFDKPPEDFTFLAQEEPEFVTTFLISHAVKQGLFSVVSNVAIPENLRKFPIFRASNNVNADPPLWFFLDGEKEWSVKRTLTPEEKTFPRGPSFPSAPLLIEMIETNYRAERDFV